MKIQRIRNMLLEVFNIVNFKLFFVGYIGLINPELNIFWWCCVGSLLLESEYRTFWEIWHKHNFTRNLTVLLLDVLKSSNPNTYERIDSNPLHFIIAHHSICASLHNRTNRIMYTWAIFKWSIHYLILIKTIQIGNLYSPSLINLILWSFFQGCNY